LIDLQADLSPAYTVAPAAFRRPDKGKGLDPLLAVIAFDADDTLWENEVYYRRGRELFNHLLSKYPVEADVDSFVHELEIRNLEYYGYGAAGFVLSLIEAADSLTRGRFTSGDTAALIAHLKRMLSAEVELLEGAREVVTLMAESHRLILITKGALRHQRTKVEDSGLAACFERIEIVSEKNADVYRGIIDACGVEPERFLMVGNSVRSDVLPVLEAGGWALYVPNELTWAHETLEDLPLENPHFIEAARLSDVPSLIAEVETSRLS
jgi:putative hydrolase of the HAD superfamily